MALEEIVARKRVDVAKRKDDVPYASFAKKLLPSHRSLKQSLSKSHTGFILECKKASPSRGVIRPDFDPDAIARSYAPFADAVSVLTDVPYFQGSFEYLSAVRREVDCPVLCKDFIVDPYQILEARLHGADAVLLMCSVLEQQELVDILGTTHDVTMEALVEVHDERELERALSAGAQVIGVNNRNLKTLEVDLSTSERLCPLVPRDRICVCESGISTRADVRRLRGICDAFLIGGHLMAQPDLDVAVRELVFGRVKICGLTSVEDARAAHAAGAVFGGVVLWPKSKRAMTIEGAASLCREVPLMWVGVFVDEAPEVIGRAASELELAAVQLHGDEQAADIEAVRAAVPDGCEVWKAQRVGPGRPIVDDWPVDRTLLDRYVAGEQGGTGERFDWRMFERHPRRADMILSGGISVDTAAQAEALGGYAIDLSSGVEQAPGKKDHDELSRLFAAVRGRGRLGGTPHEE